MKIHKQPNSCRITKTNQQIQLLSASWSFSAPGIMGFVRWTASLPPRKTSTFVILVSSYWCFTPPEYKDSGWLLFKTHLNYHLLLSLLKLTTVNKINSFELTFLTLNVGRGLHGSLIYTSTSEKPPATEISEAACSLNFKCHPYQPTSITEKYRSVCLTGKRFLTLQA